MDFHQRCSAESLVLDDLTDVDDLRDRLSGILWRSPYVVLVIPNDYELAYLAGRIAAFFDNHSIRYELSGHMTRQYIRGYDYEHDYDMLGYACKEVKE